MTRTTRIAVAVACAALGLGCAKEIVVLGDSGTDGGGGSDASPAGSVDAAPGSTDAAPSSADASPAGSVDAAPGFADASPAGSADAAPGAADASPGDAGLASYSFGVLSLPAGSAAIDCVFGKSDTEIYLGTSTGKVLRYDGTQFHMLWNEPSNAMIESIWASGTQLYVGSEANFYTVSFDGQTASSGYSSQGMAVPRIVGLSDSEVYLVGNHLDSTSLYQFDGSMLTPLFTPPNVSQLNTLFALGGVLYFGGTEGALFSRSGGVTTPETIEWPMGWDQNAIAQMSWNALWGDASDLFGAGYRQLVFHKDSDGTWRAVYTPYFDRDFQALVGWRTGGVLELYALGGDGSGGPVARDFAGVWSTVSVGDYDLWDAWLSPSGRVYAGGLVANGVDGVLLVGQRGGGG
jgi:hypothetical protein